MLRGSLTALRLKVDFVCDERRETAFSWIFDCIRGATKQKSQGLELLAGNLRGVHLAEGRTQLVLSQIG